jgi:hypothetical protein
MPNNAKVVFLGLYLLAVALVAGYVYFRIGEVWMAIGILVFFIGTPSLIILTSRAHRNIGFGMLIIGILIGAAIVLSGQIPTEGLSDCDRFLRTLGEPEGSINCTNRAELQEIIYRHTEDIGDKNWTQELYSALVIPEGIDVDEFQRTHADYLDAREEYRDVQDQERSERFFVSESAMVSFLAVALFIPALAVLLPLLPLPGIWRLGRLALPVLCFIAVWLGNMGVNLPFLGVVPSVSQSTQNIFGEAMLLEVYAVILGAVSVILVAIFSQVRVGSYSGYFVLMGALVIVQGLGGLALIQIFGFPIATNAVAKDPALTMQASLNALLLGSIAGKGISAMIPSIYSLFL